MDDTIPQDDTPHKQQCTKCNRLFPTTTEYFRRGGNKKTGLRANCKECDKERWKKWVNTTAPKDALTTTTEETPQKTCTQCGKAFPITTQYFHRDKIHRDGLSSICKECGCKKTRGQERRNPTMITLTCPGCGKEFQRRKAAYDYDIKNFGVKPFYCSRHCAHGNTIALPIPPSIDGEYLQGKSCETIGKQYNVSGNAIRNQLIKMGVTLRYCNDYTKIHGGAMKGRHHSAETVEKLRENSLRQFSDPKQREIMGKHTARRISEGKIAPASKLEDRVAIELSRQGIAFSRQFGIDIAGFQGFAACVDFMLADGRVVEVNGTYWHADPRKYPNGPIYPSQINTVERYNRKIAKLTEAGITVIELWEMDLNTDLAGTINHALGLPG